MSRARLTRREFVRHAALAAAASPILGKTGSAVEAVSTAWVDSKTLAAPSGLSPFVPLPSDCAPVRWLDGAPPIECVGTTWGVAWPRGVHARDTEFQMHTRSSDQCVAAVGGDSGESALAEPVPVQTWPIAYWPDGTLKWTAHAIGGGGAQPFTTDYVIGPGEPAVPSQPLVASESENSILVDTGVMRVTIARSGAVLIEKIERAESGAVVLRDGRLVCLRQDSPEVADGVASEPFRGEIQRVSLEQAGPVRAVVKFEGRHRAEGGEGRRWLPFVVRFYFYAGSEAVRCLHTIIYDGDEQVDFVRGLGLRFEVPLRGPLYDRHVRFSGADGDGLFGEAVQGITGLRRDPGASVRAAQIAGEAAPPLSEWSERVATRLQYVPSFADWTLAQLSCDGFEIRKRTRVGYTWLSAARGQRAGGLGYVGTPQGGVAFGLRNFWQSYPAQLDIRGAAGESAEVTVWLWAPEAVPMDMRPYHDGLGQDTYEKQYNGGLDVTYEDWEPGFDSPHGVARTSEVFLWALRGTPSRERLAAMARATREPPQLVTTPEHLARCAVFGRMWAPAERSTSGARVKIEARLDWYFDFYRKEQEARRWYGFWNYGDVMHTYDVDRHEWRYDVGGFAWDNSELSTDIWLWLHYLRTGRAAVFRFAEAMTRHTGEVDVHHLGRFAPLGSRHNVLHWGCSAKQLRISTAANRRYYYYLSGGDERTGDLMREQLDAARTLQRVPPGRKLAVAHDEGDLERPKPDTEHKVGLGFGTDWGAQASAWLTEWERTGSTEMRDRLREGMRTIGAQPTGFFAGGGVMDLCTGAFDIETGPRVNFSHLSAAFGLPELCAELIQLIEVPEFRRAWLDYCELYNAPLAEQEARLGTSYKNRNLQQGHARLTAYAAYMTGSARLAARAWEEFYSGENGIRRREPLSVQRIEGAQVLRRVDEARFISTNAVAQWGLSAIQCLALTPPDMPTKAQDMFEE